MADNGAIKYSELFEDDGGLKDLILVLDKINSAYSDLHKTIKDKATELKKKLMSN